MRQVHHTWNGLDESGVLQLIPSAKHAASDGYRSLAPYYDAFTAHPDYAAWVVSLAELGRRHGAAGARLLDVACGTGKSLEPLLGDGVSAVGVDAVPEMVEIARRRLGGRAELLVADMTRLPVLGSFDLVLCVNDVLNCLLTSQAVESALRGLAANLAPDGVLVFDLSTPVAYREHFAVDEEREADGLTFRWSGRFDGSHAEAQLDVLRGGQQVARSVHVQRHHPPEEIAGALDAAGLSGVGRYGYDYEGNRSEAVDETTFKTVHVVKRTVHPPS